MAKVSLKNLFKKSESDRESKTNKTLFVLLIILVIAVVIYWGYPLFFTDKSAKPVTTTTTTTTIGTTTGARTTTPPSSMTTADVAPEMTSSSTTEIREKTPFEVELEKRRQAYENRLFTYEPYEPPSSRDPFQKVSRASYFLAAEETAEGEESEEGNILRFPEPELPPGTKLTGIITSNDKKIAMIKMNEETFIARLYDILLDRYIVKEIKKDEVVLELNDYEFSLKMGGEETSNE